MYFNEHKIRIDDLNTIHPYLYNNYAVLKRFLYGIASNMEYFKSQWLLKDL